MVDPFIVGQISDAGAASALRGIGVELLQLPASDRLLTTTYPRPPRLFVIEVLHSELEQAHDLLNSLHDRWSLTDVLLWAPQASGLAVRMLFLAGARDVVVSRSASKLAQCAADLLEKQQILPRVDDLSSRRSGGTRFESLLSRSGAMWDLFDLCTRIAAAEATVLIVGETGTGKELLARAVHRRSRRAGRFVAANCASISPDLLNSELFGYEKGAFTGADRSKTGLVTHAHNGTLFLDEIGDMPSEAQQSLLRMLQEKRIRPVGSLAERDIDVRVVAATHVPLDQAVREGTFREDLFYRLDVIRMNVPPLRERPEDILFLFGHFTKRLAKHYRLDPPTFSETFFDALLKYKWPGNVRELQNLSERIVLARPPHALTARDFGNLQRSGLADSRESVATGHQRGWQASVDISKSLADNLNPAVGRLERNYLEAVLKHNAGRIAEAAEHAGISRRTLLRKMKLYGLEKKAFKS